MRTPPGLTVVALVFLRQGDSILLVRQRHDPQYWSLPGGMVEAGEAVEEAAVREAREETGLEVRLLRLVGLYSKPEEGALAVAFEGVVVGGRLLAATEETSDCRYFPLDRLGEPIRDHLRQRVEDFRRGGPAVWRRE